MLVNPLINVNDSLLVSVIPSSRDSLFLVIINPETRVSARVTAKGKPNELLRGNPEAKTKYSDQN